MLCYCYRSAEPLVIGKFNFFEVGAHVQASAIGDSNTFEIRCKQQC